MLRLAKLEEVLQIHKEFQKCDKRLKFAGKPPVFHLAMGYKRVDTILWSNGNLPGALYVYDANIDRTRKSSN